MTNHADLIAALRIPMNVTLREGAPELDEYDEQRKAAADALDAVWAEATAAAYGAAAEVCKKHKITSEEIPIIGEYTDDVENIIGALTPQSARDWLAAHDAEVYRRGQEDMRDRAARLMPRYFAVYSATGVTIGVWEGGYIASQAMAEHHGGKMVEMVDVSAIRALAIKGKDNE